MRILVLTPLFPPDVSAPATYAKELVTRLSREHTVTCLHYGMYPEHAAQTAFVSIKKNVSTFWRVIRYSYALWQQRKADVVCVLNGPSVELPYLLMSPFLPTKRLYIQSDPEALTNTHVVPRLLTTYASRTASTTIILETTLRQKPSRHPLDPASQEVVMQYHQMFDQHVQYLYSLCHN